jgi:hypothetical protein
VNERVAIFRLRIAMESHLGCTVIAGAFRYSFMITQ